MRKLYSLRRALVVLGACLIGISTLQADELPAGQLERIQVHGKSLDANLMGMPATRDVVVYLPPSYASSPQRRYPVIYFLHGFGADDERYVQFLGWPERIDRALQQRTLNEMIIVMPNALNAFGGAMYSNSITTGDWEGFIANDLVEYIDTHYRTQARRESRGLSGHSMGGYGTLRIGMKAPQTFVAMYAMSACCLEPRNVSNSDAALEKLATAQDVAELSVFARTTLAASAAWAPNAQRPPFFIDLPTRGGATQPDVLARYAANSPVAMVSQYVPQLRSYRAIALDIGTDDPLLPGNEQFVAALQRLGLQHRYVTYPGDHTNKVAERFEQYVLPFFSAQLESR